VYESWEDGSFGGVTWTQLGILVPAVLGGAAALALAVKALDALLLGERYAASLGLPVRRARRVVFLAVTVLAGVGAAFCGVVAFLDVAVPQVARGLTRSARHAVLLPCSLLLGATLAMLADLAAHLPGPNRVLHLNAILAVIGAPVVIWAIATRTRGQEGDR
jgi:iron complex transport system permease protein